MSPDNGTDDLDPRLIEQAADWMLRLGDGGDTATLRACQHWRQASPEHARAWARVERLRKLIGILPPELARSALERPASPRRRILLKALPVLALAAPAGWLALHHAERRGWHADVRTTAGERRRLSLPDGSLAELDAATAVDLRFDAAARDLHLFRGELLVETVPDPQASPRPFRVITSQGTLQALGTRFSVRADAGRHRLAVFEGAVRVHPDTGTSIAVIRAGEQAWFDHRHVTATQPADERLLAWRHGMLAADRMPLSALLAELARYHHGVLRCDPEIADLPVSGAFPLEDLDRSLVMLARTYPLQVHRAAGGWWTRVSAASRPTGRGISALHG